MTFKVNNDLSRRRIGNDMKLIYVRVMYMSSFANRTLLLYMIKLISWSWIRRRVKLDFQEVVKVYFCQLSMCTMHYKIRCKLCIPASNYNEKSSPLEHTKPTVQSTVQLIYSLPFYGQTCSRVCKHTNINNSVHCLQLCDHPKIPLTIHAHQRNCN